MHITGIRMTKKEMQHTCPFLAGVKGWFFNPCWRWVSWMPLSIVQVRASARPSVMETSAQTAPLSTKLWQDLGPSRDLIYVCEDVIISYLSSRGRFPFDRPALWSRPTRNYTGLRWSTGLLNETSSPGPGLHGYTTGIKMTLQNPSRLLTKFLYMTTVGDSGHVVCSHFYSGW